MNVNKFVVNTLIPDGSIALVTVGSRGNTVIWYGALADIPTDKFEQSDQSHVSQKTFDDIAARAKATGKGITVQ